MAASRRWSIVATSARSLPALLCAELGYNLRLHSGYLDPTTQTTNTTTSSTTSTTQAKLLSLCSWGQSLGLGLRLGSFQRGQWGLEGG